MPSPGASRARKAVAFAVVVPALVTAMVATSWAAPAPTPVKADPRRTETAPSAAGPWFGWAQDTRARPGRLDYFVQRGDRPRIRVNAPGTEAPSGGVLDRSVIYVQQRDEQKAQLYSFDLRNRRRTPLPPAVNDATYRKHPILVDGDVSARGPWVFFRGVVNRAGLDGPLELAVLYHRVTRELRVLATNSTDAGSLSLGQVDAPFVTWHIDRRDGASSVTRLNFRTGRTTEVTTLSEPFESPFVALCDPAVSADGTLYYWRYTQEPTGMGQPVRYERELLRRPLGRGAVVIASSVGPSSAYSATHVEDRADGSRVLFYALDGDIYRLAD